MDKDKLNSGVNKLLKDKKFLNCLIVLFIIIFLWLSLSTFLGEGISLSKSNSDAPRGAQEVGTDTNTMTTKELLSYEEKEKKELTEALSEIEGVGKVTVKMYFDSGEMQVVAENKNTQVSETQEEDKSGGTRVTNQQTDGSTIVMKTDSNTSEPFITKTYKPQITGIFIVAEGAKSSEVKYNIQKAVASLYNLSLDKVNVYPMGN